MIEKIAQKSDVIDVEWEYSWETGCEYLRLRSTLPKQDFMKLFKAELVYHINKENDLEIPSGWYISKNYLEIEKLIGYSFDSKVKKKIDEINERQRKSDEVMQKARLLRLKCPICSNLLELGEWNEKGAAIMCYKDKYTAVWSVEKGVLDEGLDETKNKEYGVKMWWYKCLLETMDVTLAKQMIEKEKHFAYCDVCGEELESMEELMEHLHEHGCDV
jgi:hypothetical protein